MATINWTHRYVSEYAESEPWKIDHNQAMRCRDTEEAMILGARLFRLVTEDEARLQGDIFRGELSPDDPGVGLIEKVYRTLAGVLEKVLDAAEQIAVQGFTVDGLDDFRLVVEEARCMVGSLDMEAEIRPIEELLPLCQGNPRPERYGK